MCESAPNAAIYELLAAMLAHVGQLGLWGARRDSRVRYCRRTRRRVARGIPITVHGTVYYSYTPFSHAA